MIGFGGRRGRGDGSCRPLKWVSLKWLVSRINISEVWRNIFVGKTYLPGATLRMLWNKRNTPRYAVSRAGGFVRQSRTWYFRNGRRSNHHWRASYPPSRASARPPNLKVKTPSRWKFKVSDHVDKDPIWMYVRRQRHSNIAVEGFQRLDMMDWLPCELYRLSVRSAVLMIHQHIPQEECWIGREKENCLCKRAA